MCLCSDVHTSTLEGLITSEDPALIIGSCLGASNPEKAVAEAHKRILFAIVGPDVFYEDRLPHVFGMHLSSYRCANTNPTVFTHSTSVIDNLIYQQEQFEGDFYTRHIPIIPY